MTITRPLFSNLDLRKLILPLVVEQILSMLFAMVLNLGVIGVWIAMGSDWLARSVAFWVRYRSGKWKAYRAI